MKEYKGEGLENLLKECDKFLYREKKRE